MQRTIGKQSARIASNPEGIHLLDQYVVKLNEQKEMTFRANELRQHKSPE
jgi:hypothetical protein